MEKLHHALTKQLKWTTDKGQTNIKCIQMIKQNKKPIYYLSSTPEKSPKSESNHEETLGKPNRGTLL